MEKKVLIICISAHHNNTMKIAEAMGEELNAKIVKANEIDINTLSEYDLIGFGSGIYNGKHHKSLFNLLEKLPMQNKKKAFVFATMTISLQIPQKALRDKLAEKRFDVIGEFACRGFMDFSFTKYILGGLNKGRPNEDDLQRAREFARNIKSI